MEHKKMRYNCDPKKIFKDICVESENGKYKSRESCINDCENSYIYHNLVVQKMSHETSIFYKFIKEIIKTENIDVYIKGGNVIGLNILKMLHDEYKNDIESFKKYFNEFLKLELIKDWDFASYAKSTITDKYRDRLDLIAKSNALYSRASTFILYQTKKPLMTDGKALFEISILDNCGYSCLEIPLTTMKVRVNEFNLKYTFAMAKEFYANKDYDFDLMLRLLENLKIIVHPCKDGFYHGSLDTGLLNEQIVEFIKTFRTHHEELPQFFITHLIDPFRLLYRLPEKNIPKTKKILKFIESSFKKKQKLDWLFDVVFVEKMLDLFTKELGVKLSKIYVLNDMDGVNKFLEGVSWKRTMIEYDKLLTEYGKKLLSNIFNPLIYKIERKNVMKIDSRHDFWCLLKCFVESTNNSK